MVWNRVMTPGRDKMVIQQGSIICFGEIHNRLEQMSQRQRQRIFSVERIRNM